MFLHSWIMRLNYGAFCLKSFDLTIQVADVIRLRSSLRLRHSLVVRLLDLNALVVVVRAMLEPLRVPRPICMPQGSTKVRLVIQRELPHLRNMPPTAHARMQFLAQLVRRAPVLRRLRRKQSPEVRGLPNTFPLTPRIIRSST